MIGSRYNISSLKVAAPQVSVQAHPQAAPRVDLAHRRRRHLRQPRRALPHRNTLPLRRAHPHQHAAASHVGLVGAIKYTDQPCFQTLPY